MTRAHLLAATLFALLLAPAGAGLVAEQTIALLNGNFELGLVHTLDTSQDPHHVAFEAVGSVLPGTTDDRGKVAAPGWTLRVFSGSRVPHSEVRWAQFAGAPAAAGAQQGVRSSGLEITYDERDTGPETVALVHSIGVRPNAGVVAMPTAVQLKARTPFGEPLMLKAGVYSVERPFELVTTSTVTVSARAYATFTLPFSERPGGLTELFLFVMGAPGEAQGRTIYIDDVTLLGASVEPRFDEGGGVVGPWRDRICELAGACP